MAQRTGESLTIWEKLIQYFSEADFMPHGHCYLWKPGLVWTHVISDFLIGMAYLGISITLYRLIKKINLPFNTIVLCFGVFIGACGWTHFNEIWNLWFSNYWYSGGVKVITALASVGTCIYLFKLRHPIYTVAEAAKLSEQRRLDLEVLTKDLEQRVEERTRMIAKKEELLTLAHQIAKVGTFEWDINTNMNRWTPELEALYGIPAGSFGGTLDDWKKLVHPDDIAETEHNIGRALKDGSFEAEWRAVWPDGSVHWLSARGFVQKDSYGNPQRMVGINIDITKQKDLSNSLLRAVKSRDEFLSIASHELKTPLTSLSLQTQTLKRNMQKSEEFYSKERIDRYIEQTEKQVHRLSRLVDDMLDISSFRIGKFSIHKERFDFCDLVKDVIERMSEQFRAAGIELTLNTCAEAVGFWDRFRIEQVLMNILSNTIKYGKGKPVTIDVVKEDFSIKVMIRDQGMGIAKEDHARIFNRFERAISANEVSGLGLGLFIAQEVVRAHRGKIGVQSSPGKGATFFFELPL